MSKYRFEQYGTIATVKMQSQSCQVHTTHMKNIKANTTKSIRTEYERVGLIEW